MKNHIVLIGLGHLGFRIVQQLHKMGRNVVAIEQNPSVETFREVQGMNIPVIQDDATRVSALVAANLKKSEYDHPSQPERFDEPANWAQSPLA
jgi:Trk K+ transport system NAD-binding subunit